MKKSVPFEVCSEPGLAWPETALNMPVCPCRELPGLPERSAGLFRHEAYPKLLTGGYFAEYIGDCYRVIKGILGV